MKLENNQEIAAAKAGMEQDGTQVRAGRAAAERVAAPRLHTQADAFDVPGYRLF